MSKFINFVLASSLIFCAAFANAQSTKVAIVDLNRAVFQSEMAKQRLNKLKSDKDFAGNTKEFEALQKKRTSLVEKWQKDSAVMTDAQKTTAQGEMTEATADLEHVYKKIKAAENAVVQDLSNEVGPRLSKIVEELIASEGIGLLLRAEAAWSAKPEFDITSKVTDKLNAGS